MSKTHNRQPKSNSGRTTDGTAYKLQGPDDAPVLVLIHGLGLCSHLWESFAPSFWQEYRVLTYDLHGHGHSAAAPASASLSTFSEQLARLLTHLHVSQAIIVGFSIGGMINRRFAMDHPDRVKSLVILNSPHDRGAQAQEEVEERAKKVRQQGAFSTFDDALQRWFTADYLASGQGADKVRAWRELVDPESYASAAWVLANGVRELIRPEVPITSPALVMTCENDRGSTPEMSYDIATEIAGAEVLIVPRLQHLGLMEEPEAFTHPIVSFLERTKK